jgi:hypothetical protein
MAVAGICSHGELLFDGLVKLAALCICIATKGCIYMQ